MAAHFALLAQLACAQLLQGPRRRCRWATLAQGQAPHRTGARPWRAWPSPGRCAEHLAALPKAAQLAPQDARGWLNRALRPRARRDTGCAPAPAAGHCWHHLAQARGERSTLETFAKLIYRRRKRQQGCALQDHSADYVALTGLEPAAAQARPARSGARRSRFARKA